MKKVFAVLLVSVMALMIFCSCGQGGSIKEIYFNSSEVTVTEGQSSTLSYMYKPSNASTKGLKWSSSNESVASVEDGTVQGVAEGQATITVMTPDGVSATCTVNVNRIEIKSLTLSTNSSSIYVGKTAQINVKVTPSTASDILDWTSSNTDIATVNSSGVVTGLKAGTSVITCTASNGVHDSCTIVVKSTYTPKSTTSSQSTHYSPKTYTSTDYIFPDSNTRVLTDYELSGISSYTAQMAINEIYARHGRHFNDASVRNYFMQKSWYVENPYYSNSMLNRVENANIAKLTKYR